MSDGEVFGRRHTYGFDADEVVAAVSTIILKRVPLKEWLSPLAR
jgi:hypothetical protein